MADNFELVIKERMNLFFEEKGITNPTTRDYGRSFMYFYAKEIAAHLHNIYEDDLEDGFDCDGKGDLGVDFLLRKEDGALLVVQSKYKGRKTNVTSGEISTFFQVPARILNKSFVNQHGNSNLKYQLRDLSADQPIDFIFVTNDKLSPRMKEEFDEQKLLAETVNANHTFYLKGYPEIKKDYTIVQTINDPIPDEVTIYIEKVNDTLIGRKRPSYLDISDLIDNDKKYKSIICTVKGTCLKNLWNRYPGTLFNYNIRGFMGASPVNRKMKETLDTEPEKFYFYNNGISAICTEMRPTYDDATHEMTSFVCKDFQIINGAQTTTTIGKYRDDNNLQKVRVLMKVTKTENIKSENKGLNKNIITYNNTQTIIKDSDFRSNDTIQTYLQKNFENFHYRKTHPYKKLQYLPKRMDVTRGRHHLTITMELLARTLYVYDNDPILIFKGTRSLFDTGKTGKYFHIFGSNGSELQVFDDRRLNKTVAVIMMWIHLDEIIQGKIRELKKQKKDKTIEYQALLTKWHIFWVYAEILRKLYSDDLDTIYKRIITGKTFESPEHDFINRWFERIFIKIAEILEKNYKNVTQTREDGDLSAFNLKNWLRDQRAFDDFKDSFKRLIREDYVIKVG